jgi:hypothetical protein
MRGRAESVIKRESSLETCPHGAVTTAIGYGWDADNSGHHARKWRIAVQFSEKSAITAVPLVFKE